MKFSYRLIWALAFSASLHINLVTPAPFQSIQENPSPIGPSKTVRIRGEIPPVTQALSWPSHQSSSLDATSGQEPKYTLPPVSDVFKSLSKSNTSTPSPTTPPATTPAPKASVAPPITQTQGDSTGMLQLIGPGIVVISTPLADPGSTPALFPENVPAPHPHPPVRKLIIIASVMGGILAVTFFVFILVDRRALGVCWRTKKSPRETWIKFGLSLEGEKEKLPMPPWLKSPSSTSHESGDEQKLASIEGLPRTISKVIDIKPGFPRSKFSVTSSDYPYTIRSSNGSSVSFLSAIAEEHISPSPLLPPSEFFCLPSATDLQNIRHSRTHSAPVFGHILPVADLPASTPRSGHHRRSKSVSGLVYIVEPSKNRKDSYEWNGSPTGGGILNAS